MKKTIYTLSVLLIAVIILAGCKKELIEENHSKLTEDFFSTPQGIESGLNAAYGGLRTLYGPEQGLEAFTNIGTDEFRIANGNRTTNVADYNTSYNSGNEFSANTWDNCYKWINTCNGLVDFGANLTGVTETVKKQKIAEAKFLRAFYYFTLVQLFGDVTLNKNFSNSPQTAATRDSKVDVYNFIISDLNTCITDLSPSPQLNALQSGRASVAAAKHLLAKVYLTRGYSNAAVPTDFKDAFDMAKGLIDQKAALAIGLMPDFADVFKPGNENKQEVLFNVQYSRDLTFGGAHTWNHLYVAPYDAYLGERNLNDGRSFAWFRATKWVYETAFADKINDSRYYKTFQSVWKATKALNQTGSGTYAVKVNGTTYNVNLPKVNVGDTAMVYPGYNMTIEEIRAKKYYVFTPENYTNNRIFPTMTKYLDPNRLVPNEDSHRPIIVFRLAETYLIAAEAAFKLQQPDVAVGYINDVRRRAAAVGKQAQMEITSAVVNIDFILDERTRELCAENTRWFDLVRTGKLVERVKAYDDYEANKNIQSFHVLRPIPLSQINAVTTGTPYPQNDKW
ncbi:RagB/SusD family nutrient uptake outer membrane protein [Pedobacter hiemivivus]|uniref:RagB/SusD family nutrient uptake outer membrane protein n=1 Tax=Pedobacter hiemivivus TaxID=2530454 RepID=A0A4R0NA45_9SPHI|nr:RagB/SusD family nutrient uptake outer membrane protein [Pedobacter hiemivivus]TCC95742.1 RagB/SusD family nutrient uptake outer membrane protein [Pedobacter hiemivivus]